MSAKRQFEELEKLLDQLEETHEKLIKDLKNLKSKKTTKGGSQGQLAYTPHVNTVNPNLGPLAKSAKENVNNHLRKLPIVGGNHKHVKSYTLEDDSIADPLGAKTQGGTDQMPEPVERRPARGGGVRKPSAWMAHVKEYYSQHGGKYSDALKNAKATYNR